MFDWGGFLKRGVAGGECGKNPGAISCQKRIGERGCGGMTTDAVDVLIHSPFVRQDSQGNSATAERLRGILQQGGLRVAVEEVWYGGVEAPCMVALNARRSAGAVAEYRDACPDGRVVLILTGTDINHAECRDEGSPTRRTMADAERLVVLHEVALESVPDSLRAKCEVIYPSVCLPDGLVHEVRESERFQVIMAGNVRWEKNVPLVLDACRLLPAESRVEVHLYGDADESMVPELLQATAGGAPFQWRGKTGHEDLLRVMAESDLLLNSSLQEGGANALCEAVALGLPVLASEIGGNLGMLGAGYGGYFPSGSVEGLVEGLIRVESDPAYYRLLKSRLKSRAERFAYQREQADWLQLVQAELG